MVPLIVLATIFVFVTVVWALGMLIVGADNGADCQPNGSFATLLAAIAFIAGALLIHTIHVVDEHDRGLDATSAFIGQQARTVALSHGVSAERR